MNGAVPPKIVTELGFVRSLVIIGDDVEAHLRLPTSFCAPNFAYLMASDAKDVLVKLDWTHHVVVELDDHHDSDVINTGLAADDVSLALRRARSTRISIDGNAHFCRGLLRTRYPEADHAQTAAFVPLSALTVTP